MPINTKEAMETDYTQLFDDFMRSHRVASNDKNKASKVITHTELNSMMGSYSIMDSDYDEFIKLYKQYILGGWEIGIVERHNGKKVGPVICDFDFKSRKEGRTYTMDHITNIIKIFNEVMIDIFDVDDDNLQAFVYEKEVPSVEKKATETLYKDGFHIYWPYVPLLVEYRYLLYEIVLNRLKKEKTIDDIPSIEPLHEVFDYRVIYNNGIMMYGSTKPGRTPYKLTKVFTSDIDEMDIDEFDFDTIIQTSLMRSYDDDQSLELKNQNLINKCITVCKKRNYQTSLQRYISNNVDDDEQDDNSNNSDNDNDSDDNDSDNDNDDSDDNDSDNYEKNNKKPKQKYDDVFREDKTGNKCGCCGKYFTNHPRDIEYIRELVSCLRRKRADSYDDWIRVGWCLHKIWHGLLPEYIKFSKLSKKYNPGDCEKIWRSSNDSGYNMPSLIFWAKQDDPDKFIEIFKNRMNSLFAKAMSTSHDDIANVLYEMYRNDYKCVDITKNIWYEFKDHRWVNTQEAYTLSERISDEVCAEFANTNQVTTNYGPGVDHRNNDDVQVLQKKVLKMYAKLKDINFKQSVLRACRGKFYEQKFEEKLNKNTKLIGFENGVFDLNTMTFRDGVPEDYLTYTTGYNFEEYSLNSPEVKGLEDYFSKVQTDPDTREYWLRLIATSIDGSTKNQQFIFWNGCGSNGKSTTFSLINEAFGDYYSTLQVEVMTGKTPDPTVPTPQLVDKRGKRFVGILECGRNSNLNVGTMKLFTGGDTLAARGLYQDTIYFKPQFKLFVATNHLPRIKDLDNGCWRRICVLPFFSRFEYKPRPGKKNEFKRDDDLPENLMKWKGAFMWYLLRIVYPRFKEAEKKEKDSGLKQSQLVIDETEKYRLDSDKYYEFLKYYCVKSNEDDKEEIKTIYPLYKDWYREAYSDRPANLNDFIEYFKFMGYKIDDNQKYLYGYKLKEEE
jgi:P4 family phage/plasmid primase-like protien